MSDIEQRRFLLVKRGLYYRPDNCGYTGIKEHAGRYREVDALGLDGVAAVHEDAAPDYSEACFHDLKEAHLLGRLHEAANTLAAKDARIAELEARNASLRHWSVGHIDALLLYAAGTYPNDSHVKDAVEFCRIVAPGKKLRMDPLKGSDFHPARESLRPARATGADHD